MEKDLLTLRRVACNANGTTGVLIGMTGWPIGISLEPVTPIIPAGRYDVIPYFSPAHQHTCFLLKDVPGHVGVEIHIGNYLRDTSGCILIASKFSLFEDVEMIEGSTHEFNHLWGKYGKTGFSLDVREIN
jgi:hypothetical protein